VGNDLLRALTHRSTVKTGAGNVCLIWEYVPSVSDFPSPIFPGFQTGNTAVAGGAARRHDAADLPESPRTVRILRCRHALLFDGIEQTVSHMQLEPPIRKNISFAYYESRSHDLHRRKAHDKLHKDVDDFINANSRTSP